MQTEDSKRHRVEPSSATRTERIGGFSRRRAAEHTRPSGGTRSPPPRRLNPRQDAAAGGGAASPVARLSVCLRNTGRVQPVDVLVDAGAWKGLLTVVQTRAEDALYLVYTSEEDAEHACAELQRAVGDVVAKDASVQIVPTPPRYANPTRFVTVKPYSTDIDLDADAIAHDFGEQSVAVHRGRGSGIAVEFSDADTAIDAIRTFRSIQPRRESFVLLDFSNELSREPSNRSKQPSRSPSERASTAASEEWSAATVRRRYNSPTRTVAFKCPARQPVHEVRQLASRQLRLQEEEVVVHGDTCFITFDTMERARAALLTAGGRLRGPRATEKEIKLFFVKPRGELERPTASDVLVLNNVDATTLANEQLTGMFPRAYGITRIDRSGLAFIRFPSVAAAMETLAAFDPRSSDAPHSQLQFSTSGIKDRLWCVVIRNVSPADVEEVTAFLGRCEGVSATFSVESLGVVKGEVATEREARRAVTALAGKRLTNGRTVMAEAHWCTRGQSPKSPQLRFNQIPIGIPAAEITETLSPFGLVAFRMTTQAGGYAWFDDEEHAHDALSRLRGVPLCGLAPPQIDYAYPPRPMAEQQPGGGPSERAPVVVSTEWSSPTSPTELPSPPARASRATSHDDEARAPETAETPAARYEALFGALQGDLPPGWCHGLANGGTPVLLDHITRRGYPRDQAPAVAAFVARQLSSAS